jgi:hypothetical protein
MRQVFDDSINTPGQFAGYYGVDARLSLQSAVALGLPRAQESLDYLMAQPGMPDDLVSRAGWALIASDVDSGTTGGGTTTTGSKTTSSGGGTTAGSGGDGGSSGHCGLGGGIALLAMLCLLRYARR